MITLAVAQVEAKKYVCIDWQVFGLKIKRGNPIVLTSTYVHLRAIGIDPTKSSSDDFKISLKLVQNSGLACNHAQSRLKKKDGPGK